MIIFPMLYNITNITNIIVFVIVVIVFSLSPFVVVLRVITLKWWFKYSHGIEVAHLSCHPT